MRGLAQGIIIYMLALMLRIHLDFSVWHVTGVVLFIILGSALFSTFSLAVACLVKTRERFMGIGQVLTMPLFFASNAIYPIASMPTWVRAVAKVNPLSYQGRCLTLADGAWRSTGVWNRFGWVCTPAGIRQRGAGYSPVYIRTWPPEKPCGAPIFVSHLCGSPKL